MKKSSKLMGVIMLSMFICTFAYLASIGYCKEQVTVEWWYYGNVPDSLPDPNSYWLLKVTYSDSSSQYYDGWCADQDTYLSKHGSTQVWLYSSTDDVLPTDISNDENWDVVNYIFNEWPTSDTGSVFHGATWKDIQQVVWIYTDTGYSPSASDYTPPNANWDKVNEIHDHIEDLLDNGGVPTFGLYEAMILDLNTPIAIQGPKQLLFFVVPEIPFGVLGAAITMFGAYYTKIRLNRRRKEA